MSSRNQGTHRMAALITCALLLSIATSARAADPWDQIPGALAKIAVGNAQNVWGINSANQIFKLNTTTRLFVQVPGALTSLSVGGDGETWGLNSSGQIYRYNPGTQVFDRVSGGLVKIAVGSAQNVWGINSANQVFKLNTSTRLFAQVPGTMTSIAAGGADGVAWALDTVGHIWHYNPAQSAFGLVGGALTSIAVAFDGTTWGINSVGGIYRYNTQLNQFLNLPGALATVAVGGSLNVWGINSAQQIFQLNTSTQRFDQVAGALATIAVGADGAAWGLTGAGHIFTRAGACGIPFAACCARDACNAGLMCNVNGRCEQKDWPLASDYQYQGDALADVEYNWTEEAQGMAAGPFGRWWISQDGCIRVVGQDAPVARDLGDCIFHSDQHVGDIDFDHSYVYAPVEYDIGTAVFRMDQIGNGVVGVVTPQPGMPWLAVNDKNYMLYSSEFNVVSADGATPSQRSGLYAYTIQDSPFSLIPAGRVPLLDENGNLLNLSKVQGGDFSDSGKLYLTTDAVGDHSIHVFSVGAGYARRIARLPVPVSDVCFFGVNIPFDGFKCIDYEELEGIAVKANTVNGVYGEIHAVMLHNQADSDNVYWKVWRLLPGSRGTL